MPVWLAAAMALARSGGALATRIGGPIAAGVGIASLIPEGGGGGEFSSDGTFCPPRRRRRRRRALTASDRADIGFITGLLGASAGKSFALTIASRTT